VCRITASYPSVDRAAASQRAWDCTHDGKSLSFLLPEVGRRRHVVSFLATAAGFLVKITVGI